jgi:hypothetical protein
MLLCLSRCARLGPADDAGLDRQRLVKSDRSATGLVQPFDAQRRPHPHDPRSHATGDLGDGTTTDRHTPVVRGLYGLSVAAGAGFSSLDSSRSRLYSQLSRAACREPRNLRRQGWGGGPPPHPFP